VGALPRRARLTVVAMGATSVALGACAAGSAGASATVDGISFASNRTGNYDVYTMNPDGSDVVDLTSDNPFFDGSPAWSPDRTQIAFSSRRGGNRDIYVINADGSGLRRITTDPGLDDFPAWSPSGERIAYSNLRFDVDGAPILQIYTAAADGAGDVRQLTNDSRFVDTRPVYSPDGAKIAFDREKNPGPSLGVPPGNAVWIMHADGSHPQQLTPPELEADSPNWSPDGSRIAFENNACPTCDVSDIFTMNPAGKNIRQLTHGIGNNLYPTWSQDGSQIVFQNTSDFATFNQDIWIMGRDGSDPVDLTNSPTVDDALRDF
jgi:Tol biopolymer transport system component